MDYNKTGYEREIDLKDLMYAVLRRWRLILIVGAIAALISGGYQVAAVCFKEYDEKEATTAEDNYKKDLQLYNHKLTAYQKEIDNMADAVSAQKEYLEESILMNMSPYDVWQARAEFFVKTDYEIMPGMTYQNKDLTTTILQAYQSALNSADFIMHFAEAEGIEDRYLKELVDISIRTSDKEYNNLLVIQIRHSQKEKAKELLEKFMGDMNQCTARISLVIKEHTITEVNQSLGAVVDSSLAEKQRNERSQLDLLMNNLSKKRDELETIRTEQKPEKVYRFPIMVVQEGLKYAALGAVLGIFAVTFVISVRFIVSDTVSSAKELKYRFQLKLLGCLPAQSSRGETGRIHRFDAWLDRREGLPYVKDIRKEYDLIAINILNYGDVSGPVFVTGGASEDRIDDVAENLAQRLPEGVISGRDLLSDPESLRSLSECGCAVLVEQCGVSSYSETEMAIEKIGDFHKKVVGCVVIE